MTEELICGRKEKQEEKMNSEPFIRKQRPEGNMTDICVAEFHSVPVPNKEINKASLCGSGLNAWFRVIRRIDTGDSLYSFPPGEREKNRF